MGRRIRWLGLALVVCFLAVIAQLANIQIRQSPTLDASSHNPRNYSTDNYRGEILAADGTTILAKSVPNAHPTTTIPTQYYRQYPGQFLYSGVVGYSSHYYGTGGIENEYNTQLSLHSQSPKSLGQLLTPPKPTADTVTLTIQPTLQQDAWTALNRYARGNKDGAVVVLNPKTGAVLAMYSQPYFLPTALAQPTLKAEQAAGKADFFTKDPEGLYPIRPFATFDRFAPGSTFKVVTTSAVYNLRPTLSNFSWGPGKCTGTPAIHGTRGIPGTTHQICNDASTKSAASTCGGKIRAMLPESCDPGYVMLGLHVGGTALYKQSELFGINSKPPIDLTSTNVSKSAFPSPATFITGPNHQGQPGLGLAAFGQGTVTLTPLQDAMIAAGVADTGKVMTPHLMSQIRNAQGGLVEQYHPTVYKQALTAAAAQQVKTLMTQVARTPIGTAYGIFPATEQVAAKTGTAQITTGSGGVKGTDDWMIALAPASDPTVAVAVCVPYQSTSQYGATTAGPIVQAMISATLAEQRSTGLVPTTTPLPNNPLPTTTTTTTTTVPPSTTTTTPHPTTTTVPSSSTTTTTAPSPTTTAPASTSTTGAWRLPVTDRRVLLASATRTGTGPATRPGVTGSSP